MRHLASAVGEYDVAGLETERVAFYERLGWELWRGPLAGRSDHGLIPTPDQRGVMILRLPRTPPFDLETPLTIEAHTTRIWCRALRLRRAAGNNGAAASASKGQRGNPWSGSSPRGR